MAASASESFKDYPSPALKLEELPKKVGGTENSNPIDLVYFRDDDLDLIPYQGYCLATPLLELSNLSLYSDYFQTISFNSYTNPFLSLQDLIHVTIKVIDNDNHDFILFDSDTCDARSMAFFGYRLNICLEKSKLNHPVWIPKYLSLKLSIEDKSTRSEIIEIFPLKVEHNVVYDTRRFLELFGTSYKHVEVYYTYFRYAMIASVDCCVLKNDDIGVESEERCVKVSGAISARFKVRDKVITRFLLNEQEGNIGIFDPAALRWSASFAVPAYSSREIVVDDMMVNQEKIDTSGHPMIFQPLANHKEKVEIAGPKWRFLVTMKWKHAYKSLRTLCEYDLSDATEGSNEESTDFLEFEGGYEVRELIEDSSCRGREKRLRLQPIESLHSDVDVIMKRPDPEPAYHFHPLNLVEVFSICVCPYVENDNCSFILGGTVTLFDFWDTHEVFNGHKQPSRLYPHQTLPMVEPPGCYQGANIRLEFDLNDKQGRQLSQGFFSWNFQGLRMWYDRRMCSIVRGKDGMMVNQEKIDTSGHPMIFQPLANHKEKVEIAGPKWRFLVTMKWKHAYKSLRTLCEYDLSDETEGSNEESTDFLEFEGGYEVRELIEDSSCRGREKRLRLQPIESLHSDVDVIMKRPDPEPAYHFHPINLVEVFSICVCPYVENDNCSFILGGTVKLFDFWDTHEVFNGHKQPSRLYPHQTLPMVEPPGCYQGANIRLEFDLNDKQGRQLSQGFFSWNFQGLRMWYDRRMCSIVRGKDGFAVVHSTVFSDAAQAVVRISFASIKDHQYHVCGRIWGRYSGYRYHTLYDRRYYQSPLFEKAKGYVALKNDEELPLLKRVVSVPTDDMLVVVVNLNVVVGGAKEVLKGKVKFKSREKTSEYETQCIETSDYKLVVSVHWG